MSDKDHVVLLVAAMLTGNTAPGDKQIAQTVLLARAVLKRIEEAACTTP